jgi:hypothetical protein
MVKREFRRLSQLALIFIVFAQIDLRADIIISNMIDATPDRGSASLTPIEPDDTNTCLAQAQMFALPGWGYRITAVTAALFCDGSGSNTVIATLCDSVRSPDNSPSFGLPIPSRQIAFLGTRTITGTGTNSAIIVVKFSGFTPIPLSNNRAYYLVLTLAHPTPRSIYWAGHNRHTETRYRETGPGALYWEAYRNLDQPTLWTVGSMASVNSIVVEGDPAPQLIIRPAVGETAELQLMAPTNQTVTLEFKNNFSDNWQTFLTTTITNGPVTAYDSARPTNQSRFYRLKNAP